MNNSTFVIMLWFVSQESIDRTNGEEVKVERKRVFFIK